MGQKRRLNEDHDHIYENTAKASIVSNRKELEYLTELLPQLRKIAMGIEEPTLVRLLEMAALEAQLQLQLQIELEPEFCETLQNT